MAENSPKQRTALFTGSFDPFTTGHKSILDRGLQIFDKVIVAIGTNTSKKSWMPLEERIQTIRALYAGNPAVEVVTFDTLAVEAARRWGVTWILRGARTAADFDYERNMADVNRTLIPGYPVETLILPAPPELAAVSSSLVRELAAFHADYSRYLPRPL